LHPLAHNNMNTENRQEAWLRRLQCKQEEVLRATIPLSSEDEGDLEMQFLRLQDEQERILRLQVLQRSAEKKRRKLERREQHEADAKTWIDSLKPWEDWVLLRDTIGHIHDVLAHDPEACVLRMLCRWTYRNLLPCPCIACDRNRLIWNRNYLNRKKKAARKRKKQNRLARKPFYGLVGL